MSVFNTHVSGMTDADLDRTIARLRDHLRREDHAAQLAFSLTVRYDRAGRHADLREALEVFDIIPHDDQGRADVARALVLSQVRAAMAGQPFYGDRARAMVRAAGDRPDLPGSSTALLAMVHGAEALRGRAGVDHAAAIRALDAAAAALPPDSPLLPVVESQRLAIAFRLAGDRGDTSGMNAALQQMRQMVSDPRLGGRLGARHSAAVDGFNAMVDAMDAVNRGDLGAIWQLLGQMDDMPDELWGGVDWLTASMRETLGQLRVMMQQFGFQPPGASPRPAPPHPVEIQARAMPATTHTEPDAAQSERALRDLGTAMAAAMQAWWRRDVAGVHAGTAALRAALERMPLNDGNRAFALASLGRMLCLQCQVDGDRSVLTEARRLLHAAVEIVGGPAHPVWPMVALARGHCERLVGNGAAGLEWGLRALRGHAWAALLQSDRAAVGTAVQHAADEALEVAAWCLFDGDATSAVLALESGRSLLLHAVTTTRTVAERLHELGRPALADQWDRRDDASDPVAVSNLRYEVLEALAGGVAPDAGVAPGAGPGVGGLLDPPSVYEIQAALKTTGSSALVYLAPESEHGEGAAVIVPRDAAPYALSLPRLTTRADPVRGLITALDALAALRDAPASHTSDSARDDAAYARWEQALHEVCGWAGQVALNPLLQQLADDDRDFPPHVVLVPFGELAVVPWHAARVWDGRPAVAHAAFSYAASARLHCISTRRRAHDLDGSGLVVADPPSDNPWRDLPAARDEARALATLYPSAAVLHDHAGGGVPDRAAMLGWLTGARSPGAMLHISCHGVVTPGDAGRSYIQLVGSRLPADEIVSLTNADIRLVSLAACTSAVATGTYDEAFSIATAFQVAGATTVLGSMWEVPDDATSLLMFMTHRFIRVDGCMVHQALRRAQLWMLDPDRTVPDTMPDTLAMKVADIDPDDITAWAGFTHLGR